ncbi:MAG: recombinase family protein [Vicinamibacterales bacterium]
MLVGNVLPTPENGSNLPPMVGAVIYVRVSDPRQTENLSLSTQLRACEEYCRREGFEVLERFKEEGESAKTADRPELQRLLTYCRKNKGNVHFVVVLNLTRFAREKYDHFALRSHLKSLGISLRSATEPIDDTSTGKLMEGVLAAFAQFDNDVRSDRTRGGMKAALELGRWVFLAPLGYMNVPKSNGKSLMPDPERAPLVQQTFEDFATARFSKQELLERVTRKGLRTRRGLPLSSQALGPMLQNQLYIGIVDAPGYGIVGKRGDFDPLIPDDVFYRVQAILSGRLKTTAPHQRRRPEFPLRAFIKCAACGRGVTASWSKGRSARYAYYHCLPPCRAVYVPKAELEGLFVEELERFQPTAGYMRLLKRSVLQIWYKRKADASNEVALAEQRTKPIQQKLDRLDDLFIYKEAIDIDTYERQRDRLRQDLMLIEIDRHAGKLDQFDVEGTLNFAERVLPRAADVWIQSSLDQRQRLQRLFFPEGVAFSGKRFDRTAVTYSLFEYLRPFEGSEESLVDLTGIEPVTS